jgi:hypothetical protein
VIKRSGLGLSGEGLEETVAAHPAMRSKYPTISSERSVHHHNSGQPGLTLRPHNNNRPVRGRRRHIYAIGKTKESVSCHNQELDRKRWNETMKKGDERWDEVGRAG